MVQSGLNNIDLRSKMDIKAVFDALPHVTTIWVTEDGNFHLHPHNGGTKTEKGTEVINKERPKGQQKK